MKFADQSFSPPDRRDETPQVLAGFLVGPLEGCRANGSRLSQTDAGQIIDGRLDAAPYAATLRVTGLVVDNKEEALLVHLGAGFSYRDPSGGSRKFEARPSVSTGAKFVSATIVADDISLFCFELAGAWKALHAQAEFFLSASSAEGGAPEPGYSGWYVQVGYFLTGEHRPYSRANAAWDRVRPKMNFHDGSGGKGAWEVLIRWASIDLNDDGVSGGEMDDLAVGVNWYWNPNTRLMANFVWGDIDGTAGPGELTVIQWRLQIPPAGADRVVASDPEREECQHRGGKQGRSTIDEEEPLESCASR